MSSRTSWEETRRSPRGGPLRRGVSVEQPRLRLCGTHRLGYTIGFECLREAQLHTARDLVDRVQVSPHPDTRPNGDRGREANAVIAVVDAEVNAGHPEDLI